MAGGHPRQRVALIATVLDEAASIGALLDSVALQTRAPDEIVIVDGGSRDGTWDLLQRRKATLPLQCIRAPGVGIARGRNLAIARATSELIAVTDAGVRLAPDWLAQLLAGVTDEVAVVAGFFRPEADTPFEKAMAATVLPAAQDVDAARFLPSSRSVLFRRGAWAAIGGYPEWLDYCEDLVFDLDLQRAGYRFRFAPRAVAWFRPRGSLSAFFRQYYRYARGDGKADLWLGRHLIRYATYTLAVCLAAAGAYGAQDQRRAWTARVLLLAGLLAYTRRPYARLKPYLADLGPNAALCSVALVPVIRAIGDLAKMLGYPVGVVWRLRRTSTSPS